MKQTFKFLHDTSELLSSRYFYYILFLACFEDEVLIICLVFKKVYIFNFQNQPFADVFQNRCS